MALRAALAISLAAAAPWAAADSLFTPTMAKGGTLIAEQTARFEVGDLITVLVQEKVDASTLSDTNTKKESDVESEAAAADNQFFLASPSEGGHGLVNSAELPNWGIAASNEAKTKGRTRRQSTLTTTITCFVTKVLPNGNLMLEGEKQVTVNREDSGIVVRGMVRSKDVTPANTILSSQMAGATVQLKGKGPLWNNQRRGLLTKVLDWFSPF